jgi:type VI secretion system VasD/TssJ family lipoprotein
MFVRNRGLKPVVFLTLAVVLALGGCGSLGLKSGPATDKITFVGDAKLNSCSGDDYSYPVVVRVFYLSQKDAFAAADFQDLWENDEEALQGTRLEPPINLTIAPGAQTPSSSSRPVGAAYLGIVANFCRQDGSAWRTIIPLDKAANATVRLKDVHLSVE